MRPVRLAITAWSVTCAAVVTAAVITAALAFAAAAQEAKPDSRALDDLVAGVVQIKTFINPDGSTVGNLGRSRGGSAGVIDDNGRGLTIGSLMVVGHAAG